MKPNTLAIAVASGRIGYVYLTDGEARDWGVSLVASRSPERAEAKVAELLSIYRPQLIITEKLSVHSRKSGRTIKVIEAVSRVAQADSAHHVEIEHIQQHPNKYVEMDALARRHPALEHWKPAKRKLWESEDRRTTIWHALALADQADV
jgi:hypothetical protein